MLGRLIRPIRPPVTPSRYQSPYNPAKPFSKLPTKSLTQKAYHGSDGFAVTAVLLGLVAMALVAITVIISLACTHYDIKGPASYREAAQSEMEVLASALERDFTLTDIYTDIIGSGEFKVSAEVEQHYALRIETTPTKQTTEIGKRYTIIASPINENRLDVCDTLSLTSDGDRLADKDFCWN